MKKRGSEDIYVIGGESVYRALLPYCEEVLVTKVNADGDADTFFPDLDADENFERAEESEEIEDNGFEIRFMRYRNKKAERL